MAIADDFSVASNGDIRYTGDAHAGAAPGYYTVLEFHRWLGDLADNAVSSPDDILDITYDTPSERSTDNIVSLLSPYNIDQTASEHLYDGSIIQAGGDDIWDGIVNFGNTAKINILQNGARVTNDFWNSFTPSGFNADATQGISHRFMIKVRTSGADIDGRKLLGMSRQFGKTYSEFPISATTRGNNVLALSEADDLNNATAAGTVSTWIDIVNDKEGYSAIDADSNTVDEYYYSNWELGSRSKNQFYERMKYLVRDGETTTIYGLAGEIFRGITHEITVSQTGGTFVEPESVTWTGGSGQILAVDSTTAATKMWIQLLTGSAPSSGTVTGNGGATATASAALERTVSVPFVGQSTGSAIIGAYGFGIGADDLGSSDRVFDLTNTQITPPNNVTFTVTGIVSGEDRVLVGPESGGALQVGQLTLNTSLTTDNITSVVATASIPVDTPLTGTIRVQDDDGVYRRLVYTGYSGSTFTIDPTASEAAVPNVADFLTGQSATAPKNIFISYIDELASATSASFTTVYNVGLGDRALFIRVRDGGTAGDTTAIKTFETTGTLGSAGGSSSAIRTSDA